MGRLLRERGVPIFLFVFFVGGLFALNFLTKGHSEVWRWMGMSVWAAALFSWGWWGHTPLFGVLAIANLGGLFALDFLTKGHSEVWALATVGVGWGALTTYALWARRHPDKGWWLNQSRRDRRDATHDNG